MNENVYKALMNIYTREKNSIIFDVRKGKISINEFKKDMEMQAKSLFPEISNEEIYKTIDYIVDNLFSYAILTPLIKDLEISDIKIIDWDHIVIKRNGKR